MEAQQLCGKLIEIYSEPHEQWLTGEIVDSQGDWVVVRYSDNQTKQVQIFSNILRPIASPCPSAHNQSEFIEKQASIDTDLEHRHSWTVGSEIEVFSQKNARWHRAEIINAFQDLEGRWLVVRYDGTKTKEIQRSSKYVRSVTQTNDRHELTMEAHAQVCAVPRVTRVEAQRKPVHVVTEYKSQPNDEVKTLQSLISERDSKIATLERRNARLKQKLHGMEVDSVRIKKLKNMVCFLSRSMKRLKKRGSMLRAMTNGHVVPTPVE